MFYTLFLIWIAFILLPCYVAGSGRAAHLRAA